MIPLAQLQVWQEELQGLSQDLSKLPINLRDDVAIELQKSNEALSHAHQTSHRSGFKKYFRRATYSRHAIDALRYGYIETNPWGIIQRTNTATALLFNFPCHWLTGQPFLVFIDQPERLAFLSAVTQLRYGKIRRQEFLITMRAVSLSKYLAHVAGERKEDADNTVFGIAWQCWPA